MKDGTRGFQLECALRAQRSARGRGVLTLALGAALSSLGLACNSQPAGDGGAGGATAGTGPSSAGTAPTGGSSLGGSPAGGTPGSSGSGGTMAGARGSAEAGSQGAGAPGMGGQAGAAAGAPSGGSSPSSGGASGGSNAAGAGVGANGTGGSGGAVGSGGTGGAGTSGAGTGGKASTGALSIMPLGDSITAASCYRPKLWKKLTDAGLKADFIGSRTGNGCSEPAPQGFDADNEGHGCYLVTHLLRASGERPSGCMEDPYAGNSSDLARWFDARTPDVVLMHFGTNDVWNGIAREQILSAYTAILTKLRMRNPGVKLYVAKIIPMRPNASMPEQYTAAVNGLNEAIPGWATTNTTTSSPITVVDQNTGYDVTHFSDGVHPTPEGAEHMAQKWFDAIRPLF